jgi:hypothetical protein
MLAVRPGEDQAEQRNLQFPALRGPPGGEAEAQRRRILRAGVTFGPKPSISALRTLLT